MRPSPGALLVALGLDLLVGEPPPGGHPVEWIGRALAFVDRKVRQRDVVSGAVGVLSVTAAAAGVATVAGWMACRLGWMGVLAEGCLLKPTFALRGLAEATGNVAARLGAGDLAGARAAVGRDLVSRPTATLSAPEVASAAIESLAENLTDSVLAPLVAYASGGLPAAWAYRAVNTADAMWGYRDVRYERFGKAAARLDDAVNLIPAPLAAAAIAVGAVATGAAGRRAIRTAWRQHRRTASPNAGWPMAAMAGALGTGLVKPGHYRLGDGPLPAGPDTLRRAGRIFWAAAAASAGAALAVAWARRR